MLLFPTQAQAFGNLDQYLIGDWDGAGGETIHVTANGDVLTDTASPLAGRVGNTFHSGANFEFDGSNASGDYFCAYHINFLNGYQTSDWRLVNRSAATPCPRGFFNKLAR